MTYNVFGGTLSLTQSNACVHSRIAHATICYSPSSEHAASVKYRCDVHVVCGPQYTNASCNNGIKLLPQQVRYVVFYLCILLWLVLTWFAQ